MATFQQYHLPLASRAATGDAEMDGAWDRCISIHAGLRVTAGTGSMTVKIQRTLDGANWDDVLTFSAATGATHERKSASLLDATPMHWAKRLRVLYTITTGPFTFSVDVEGKG